MNKYEVATLAAINGLDDGNKHQLSEAQQKKLFGYVAIKSGKVIFDSNNQGTVYIERYSHSRAFSYETFAQNINEQKVMSTW